MDDFNPLESLNSAHKKTPKQAPVSDKNALRKLMEAFHKRFHRIIEVIDDALNSEQLKDRIWAVEQMLKRVKLDAIPESFKNKKNPKNKDKKITELSDDELLKEIKKIIKSDGQDDFKH